MKNQSIEVICAYEMDSNDDDMKECVVLFCFCNLKHRNANFAKSVCMCLFSHIMGQFLKVAK